MALTLHGPLDEVELLFWWETPSRGRAIDLRDRSAARAALARARTDAADVRALRRFVAEQLPARAFQLDDAAVFDQVVAWLATGKLRLALPPREIAARSGKKPEAQAPIAEPARPAAASEPAPALVESTFPDDIDAPAIAAAMKEAARLGIPFCEECTRKRLAQGRAGAPQGGEGASPEGSGAAGVEAPQGGAASLGSSP